MLDLLMIIIGGNLVSPWDFFRSTMFEAVHNFRPISGLPPSSISRASRCGKLPFLPHEMEFNGIDPVLEERYI